MTTCFADTAYFIALINPRDESHEVALAQARITERALVLSSAIILELANHFANPVASRAMFNSFLTDLRNTPSCRIIYVDEALFERATRLYSQRTDKAWSLTDCISFELMHEMGLSEALTTDHHFEQAGFKALLR